MKTIKTIINITLKVKRKKATLVNRYKSNIALQHWLVADKKSVKEAM